MYPGTWIWEKTSWDILKKIARGWGCRCRFRWHCAIFFWNLTQFFDIQFKNTSNLIFKGFKVPSKRFFQKYFKTGLTFWHMWFKKIENWVRSCQHIGGTLCIWYLEPSSWVGHLLFSLSKTLTAGPHLSVFIFSGQIVIEGNMIFSSG